MCFDGKFALAEAIAMSFPLHDDNILSSLRLMSIHKGLVLRKFEKYVVSYVMVGSLITGTSTETSDIDVYVVVDDTDVKRMNRFELREKLRSIIWSYAIEAEDLAGVRNKLNCQVYILTEFWESVKDAHPVIFTMIRDGVPLYDRGAFMPWKLLLKMGKIKPSPEAIDMFMSLGERVSENVRMRLNEILANDIFWGVVTPSQAVLMLLGVPPPTPKEMQHGEFRKIFVEKEKLLEPKYADILEKIITAYKKYEHDPKIAILGKEIDEMTKDSTEYVERLKKLMKQIEQKMADKEVVALYDSIFDLLEKAIGKCSETTACEKLEKELISRGLIPSRSKGLLHEIIDIKKKYKKETVNKRDVATMKKAVYELTNILTEYMQRKEIFEVEKKKIYLIYKKDEKGRSIEKKAELFVFKEHAFLIPDLVQESVKKIVQGKILDSNREELMANLKNTNGEKYISKQLMDTLKKIIGDFEISII
jgi:predicted nucleotidyltransferase